MPAHDTGPERPDPDGEDWQDRAACVGMDEALFFPGRGSSYRPGREICAGCEVKADCLRDALERDERFGMRGGLSPTERRLLRFPRGAAKRSGKAAA